MPAFGPRRIDTIKPQDVQAFKVAKWNQGEVGQGLGRSTVNQVLQTLRAVFTYAVDCEYI